MAIENFWYPTLGRPRADPRPGPEGQGQGGSGEGQGQGQQKSADPGPARPLDSLVAVFILGRRRTYSTPTPGDV